MKKIKIGILGATGIVGTNYIKLLQGHPWFQIADVAASPRSAGKTHKEAVKAKWHMNIPIPEELKGLIVRDVQDFDSIPPELSFVFSAITMPKKEQIKEVELKYEKILYRSDNFNRNFVFWSYWSISNDIYERYSKPGRKGET